MQTTEPLYTTDVNGVIRILMLGKIVSRIFIITITASLCLLAVQVTGKMLHFLSIWKLLITTYNTRNTSITDNYYFITNYTNLNLKTKRIFTFNCNLYLFFKHYFLQRTLPSHSYREQLLCILK